MATLAIKGHATRGKEVIELLKMLGGSGFSEGQLISCAYFINNSGTINITHVNELSKNYVIFTLEEFLEKFPYKVGDKVLYYENPVFITKMEWIEDSVSYHFYYKERELMLPSKHLQPYKEQESTGEQTYLNPKANKAKEEIEENLKKAKEIIEETIKIDIPQGYEFAGVDNQQVVFEKIKHRYPKTYEECCDVLVNYDRYREIIVAIPGVSYKSNLIEVFTKLIICRDAYWKLAEEQMGLGKPWSPSKNDTIYCIFRLKGEIVKDNFVFGDSLILEFPTEEMRDAFLENFGHLIEICKELL